MTNAANYFRVLADPSAIDRWFIDEPRTADGTAIDERDFILGKAYLGPTPHSLRVGQAGKELRFNFGGFDMPVVSNCVASVMQSIAHERVECFPVRIDGALGQYTILNVACRQDCLDECRSRVMKWTPQDTRPERIGQYRMVTELFVDRSRTAGSDIFRIAGWEIALIVSDVVKHALERIDDLGARFVAVS
jgi:hypothetical protein